VTGGPDSGDIVVEIRGERGSPWGANDAGPSEDPVSLRENRSVLQGMSAFFGVQKAG
jgi:hypothetical protein